MAAARARTALISGASAGIGKAAAAALAARGYDLFLGGRDTGRLAETVRELEALRADGRFVAQPFDVRHPEAVEAAVAAMVTRFGRIDLLVTSAGVGEMDFLDRLDPQGGILEPIETNLTGTILLVRAVLPTMFEQRAGTIVLIGSLAGRVATPSYSVYAATKFGLMGFADALRREVRPWGVRVSVLLPGAVATGFAEESVLRRRTRFRTPARFQLTPERVGRAVADLAARPRRMQIVPWWMRPLTGLARAFPGLVDALTERLFVVPERFSDSGRRRR